VEMTQSQRRWEAWMAALTDVLAAFPADLAVTCPSHNDGTVRVAFTGDPVTRIGYYTAWCDTCHEGIASGRAGAPQGMPVIALRDSDEGDPDIIPDDVRLLPPDPYLGDDAEEHTF